MVFLQLAFFSLSWVLELVWLVRLELGRLVWRRRQVLE
jgi:hypothetical protein